MTSDTTIFKGWVPTVSGRLSFSTFGEARQPTPAITANVADLNCRYVIAYQARNALDVILPFKSFLSEMFFDLQGNMWFLCLAKTTETGGRPQEALRGVLLLFHEKQMWRGVVENKVKSAQHQLKQFRYGLSGNSLETYFDANFNNLVEILPKYSSFNVSFEVLRTGSSTLTLTEPLTISPNAPKFHPELKRHQLYIITAQLFFFLRDIGHRHQHHDPRTDTIVDLYRVDGEADDLHWRLGTLFSIYRKIITYKRNPHSEVFHSSLGVLAYATTFRRICEIELSNSDQKKLPEFHVESMERSIKAAQDKLLADKIERRERNAQIRASIVWALGFALSLAAILSLTGVDLKVTPDPLLIFLATAILTNPITSVGVMAAAVISILMAFGALLPENWKSIRALVRLFQYLPQKILAAIFLLLSMISFILLWAVMTLL